MASDFATHLSLLEALWRSAVPTLPAGEAGWTTEPAKSGELLGNDELPHVFSIAPQRTKEPLGEHQQYVKTYTVEFNLWADREDTLEEVSAALDAFEASLAANPTLGGTARESWCYVVGFPREAPGRREKVGIVYVRTVVEI